MGMRSLFGKRVVAVGAMAIGFGAVGGVIAHAAVGKPEVDRANATIALQGQLTGVSCVGEDGVSYDTLTGAWTGSEAQVLPDPTDYSLSGSVTVSGIKWTINTSTKRGVLTAGIALADAAGGGEYKGALTLVTQGIPAAGAVIPARGWISAKMTPADEGVTPSDDSLIANVEFGITTSGATGEFGDVPSSMGTPDFSVVTNVAPKAADGVC